MLGLESLTKSISGVLETVAKESVNSFRLHSGACDILIVRHGDHLRSSAWHVHTGKDISVGENALVRLQVAGVETEVSLRIGDDKKCFFEGGAGDLRPSQDELAALQLKTGFNEAKFCVVELNGQTMRWDTKAQIPAGIFLWDALDKVVVADVEGPVVKGDLWSKGADVVMLATSKQPVEGVPGGLENVREGVSPFLSYLDRAGYRVLFLTSAPITRADRVRDTMNSIRQAELQQWGRGASVPASPIMTSPDRMGTVLMRKLSDRTLGKLTGGAEQTSTKERALTELRALFASEEEQRGPAPAAGAEREKEKASGGGGGGSGPFCGGLCENALDAAMYEAAGVPKERIFVIDKIGRVEAFSKEHAHLVWASYVDMYPALTHVFPKTARVSRSAQ